MSSPQAVILLIVHDQDLRYALHAVLALHEGIELAGEVASAAEALSLAERLGPHVTIITHDPPALNGVAYAQQIRARQLPTHVILLDVHETGAAAQDEVVAAKFDRTLLIDEFVETVSRLFKSL